MRAEFMRGFNLLDNLRAVVHEGKWRGSEGILYLKALAQDSCFFFFFFFWCCYSEEATNQQNKRETQFNVGYKMYPSKAKSVGEDGLEMPLFSPG